jgi:hypothetical protein
MSRDYLFQGDGAPLAVALRVTSTYPAGGFDLTTVTAVAIAATYPDGTPHTWTATASAVTTVTGPGNQPLQQLVVTHALDGTETLLVGAIVARARLTVPSGVIPTDPARIFVRDPNDLTGRGGGF